MGRYTVWGRSELEDWSFAFETDDREKANERAERLKKYSNYQWIALDDGDETIWTSDPNQPVRDR